MGKEDCLVYVCLSIAHTLFCKCRHTFTYQVNGAAGLPRSLASYFACKCAREIETSYSHVCLCVGACVHVYGGMVLLLLGTSNGCGGNCSHMIFNGKVIVLMTSSFPSMLGIAGQYLVSWRYNQLSGRFPPKYGINTLLQRDLTIV